MSLMSKSCHGYVQIIVEPVVNRFYNKLALVVFNEKIVESQSRFPRIRLNYQQQFPIGYFARYSSFGSIVSL